jgi:hypothetical protein
LSAPPGYRSYRWSNNGTAPEITVGISGTYTVTVEDTNGCRVTSEPVTVTVASAAGMVALQPAQLQGAPGDIVSANLILPPAATAASGCSIGQEMATIRFNATLLALAEIEGGTLVEDRIDGRERLLTLGRSRGDTVRMKFMVGLGDAESTLVTLDSFVWATCPGSYPKDTLAEFRLLGVCREGGTRLFHGAFATALKGVRPNPASGIMEIEYEVAESGRSRLLLLDIMGGTAATLDDRELEPGAYSARFDTAPLPAGAYFCVLLAPSGSAIQPVQIVR